MFIVSRNYHFFEKLVRDILLRDGLGKNCSSLSSGSRPTHGTNSGLGSANKSGTSSGNGRGLSRNFPDKCAPKVTSDSFVGCALYGLTNLKSFSQNLNHSNINYCSLSGAWSLIDTPEFAVQITNKGGLRPLPKDITTTTLVS